MITLNDRRIIHSLRQERLYHTGILVFTPEESGNVTIHILNTHALSLRSMGHELFKQSEVTHHEQQRQVPRNGRS